MKSKSDEVARDRNSSATVDFRGSKPLPEWDLRWVFKVTAPDSRRKTSKTPLKIDFPKSRHWLEDFNWTVPQSQDQYWSLIERLEYETGLVAQSGRHSEGEHSCLSPKSRYRKLILHIHPDRFQMEDASLAEKSHRLFLDISAGFRQWSHAIRT